MPAKPPIIHTLDSPPTLWYSLPPFSISGNLDQKIILYHSILLMDSFDIGYIVGLMVGEGTFTGGKAPYIGMKLHQDDPKPLDVLKKHLGGKIYGPYFHQNRKYLIWKIVKKEELNRAILFFDLHLPESLKRQKYLIWKDKYQMRYF